MIPLSPLRRAAPVALLLLLVGVVGAGCGGVATAPLEAFDVVITPAEDCTLTGATTRDCVDPARLAQQSTRGRWVFEHGVDSTFTVTTESGLTVPGILFDDDGQVLVEAPCNGVTDGLCYFGRRRFESTDDRNNGCTAFGELVIILLRAADGTFSGIVADTSGTDQDCGTSTVVQRRDDVTGVLVAEPVKPRELAEEAP